MEDGAHLNVITGLIDAVQRLQAKKEHCNHSNVHNLGVESEDLAVEAASTARKVKRSQEKILRDAFVILGVSVPSIV